MNKFTSAILQGGGRFAAQTAPAEALAAARPGWLRLLKKGKGDNLSIITRLQI
ncbi:MAG: hypothetical protein WKF97_23505 [Chitinophagaceae bacterium]